MLCFDLAVLQKATFLVGAASQGAMTLKFELVQSFLYNAPTPKFSHSEVIVFTNKHSKKTTRFAVLCCWIKKWALRCFWKVLKMLGKRMLGASPDYWSSL